jgi:biotin transport system substrate-specific component
MSQRTLDSFLVPTSDSWSNLGFASRSGFQVLAGAALIALAAQVRIPVPGTAVPMTLQSLAVLFLGLTMAPSRSVGAVTLYVLAGTFGLPVFAANSLGLFGPTGGYLLGFVPGVWLTAVLRGRGCTTWPRLAASAASGIGVVFLCGVAWLAWWLPLSMFQAIAVGISPFAGKALIEILLAAGVAAKFHGWRQRVRFRTPSTEKGIPKTQ